MHFGCSIFDSIARKNKRNKKKTAQWCTVCDCALLSVVCNRICVLSFCSSFEWIAFTFSSCFWKEEEKRRKHDDISLSFFISFTCFACARNTKYQHYCSVSINFFSFKLQYCGWSSTGESATDLRKVKEQTIWIKCKKIRLYVKIFFLTVFQKIFIVFTFFFIQTWSKCYRQIKFL